MAKGTGRSSNGEVQVQKSPAEFFAENQAIAGFDNMGKSLYTSIRELIENSLDACESIDVLPNIAVSIEELTKEQFNKLRGISQQNKDVELFRRRNETAFKKSDDKTPARKKASQEGYFIVKVKDNGCGMKHENIPDLLGRVLSGSKYGVRQTRGKFGLGAKMAYVGKHQTQLWCTFSPVFKSFADTPVLSGAKSRLESQSKLQAAIVLMGERHQSTSPRVF